MDSLWGNLVELDNEQKPEDILKDQFQNLENMTSGRIKGRVERFDKTIREMSTSLMTSAIVTMQEAYLASPQQYLGEICVGEAALTFEVFITCRTVPNYKYRFMFIQHGISPYPVTVLLEKDILTNDTGENETKFSCQNKEQFVELLEKVLKSDRVMMIINRLYSYQS